MFTFHIFQVPASAEVKKRRAPKGTATQLQIISQNGLYKYKYFHRTYIVIIYAASDGLLRKLQCETPFPAEVALTLCLSCSHAELQNNVDVSLWRVFVDQWGNIFI